MGRAAQRQSGRVQRCQWAGLSGALAMSRTSLSSVRSAEWLCGCARFVPLMDLSLISASRADHDRTDRLECAAPSNSLHRYQQLHGVHCTTARSYRAASSTPAVHDRGRASPDGQCAISEGAEPDGGDQPASRLSMSTSIDETQYSEAHAHVHAHVSLQMRPARFNF